MLPKRDSGGEFRMLPEQLADPAQSAERGDALPSEEFFVTP